MKLLSALLVFACLLPAQALGSGSGLEAEITLQSAPVVFDGATLFRVRGVGAYPAERRAEAIAVRLQNPAEDPSLQTSSLRIVEESGLPPSAAATTW